MSSTEGKRRQYKMPVWVLCVLFLLFESPTPSTSQLCSTEKIENMIIDIESALQYGVRGTEPIYSSMEDHCINLCCAGEQIEGLKTCNFVIFDKTKTVGHPNCYMFNCPLSAGACPMKPSEGMNSYKLIQDFPPGAQDSKKNVTTELSKVINVIDMHLDTDKRNQAEQENVKRENIPGPGGDDGSLGEDGPVEGLGPVGGVGAGFRKAATTVSKESMASVKPSATSEAKTSKITILPATTMPKFAKTVTTTTTTMIKPSATNRTIITSKSITTTEPPTTTTAKPTTTTPTMTNTTTTTKPTTTATNPTTTSTKQTTTTTTTTKATSTTPTTTTKPTTTATSPTTTSTKQTTTTTTTKPTTTTTAAPEHFATIASVNLAPKDSGRPNPAKPNLKAASGQAENLQDGMKSGLIANLVFGVMFMALVVGLLSQKAIESFKRRHYSRVDYLVNGMYIDT